MHNDLKETSPLRFLFTPQWVMNICLLYSHTTQVWRSVVGGHDSPAPIQPLDFWNYLKNGPLWANFFLSYENLSQAVPLKDFKGTALSWRVYLCHPPDPKIEISGAEFHDFEELPGQPMITGRFGQDRWPHERSKARTVFVSPRRCVYLLSRKVGVQPSFQNLLKTFLGWKKWFPLRVGQAKKKEHTFLLRPSNLHHSSEGLRGGKHITSQRLRNGLSPRIRVKLREKDLFHKKNSTLPFRSFLGPKTTKSQ